jgi:hypothetical protein
MDVRYPADFFGRVTRLRVLALLVLACSETLLAGVARADFSAPKRWAAYNTGGLCITDGSGNCKPFESREAVWALWADLDTQFCYWAGGEFQGAGLVRPIAIRSWAGSASAKTASASSASRRMFPPFR